MTGPTIEDAAAIVLLLKRPSIFTRADYDTWILRHILRPLAPAELDDDNVEVVEVTTDSHHLPWTRHSLSENPDSPLSPDHSLSPPLRSISYDPIVPSPLRTPARRSSPQDRRFRITPETRIYSFAARYRMVFVVDITPSMSVIDDSSGKAKALISVAFETLCKCLDGICRPFSMKSTMRDGTYDVEPVIYVTVLAECGTSYFRSEQSPLAADFSRTYPTRVLLQEVVVTRNNMEAVAERLYDALNAYEHDLVQQRQRDTRSQAAASADWETQDNIGPLDEAGFLMADTAEYASLPSRPIGANLDTTPSDSVFKAVNRGLFALNLLPEDCMSALVVITDGVVSPAGAGEQIARDCCRKLSRENAVFTIIQVGAGDGYTPGTNFGHVADNEFLRFLGIAAAGTFLYGADCNYLDGDSSPADSPPPPNFYHRHLLFRDGSLTKSGTEYRYRVVNGSRRERSVDCPRGRLLNASVDTTQNISLEELSFPWDPTSKPPLVAEILCGYRDYTLNINLEYIISARLHEGFVLSSVHVTPRSNRPDKVEVILTMPWFTNVTVMYTIKTTWTATDRPLLTGRSQKLPRIELNILAQHAFAILFINAQNLEQKNTFNHAIEEKLVKLHAFLRRIYETDDSFKVLASYNTKYALSVIPQTEQRMFPLTTDNALGLMTSFGGRPATGSPGNGSHGTNTPNNYWQVLAQIMTSKWESFYEWTCDVILRSTSTGGESLRSTKRQVATIYLNDHLTSEWCTFAVGKGRFLKFVQRDGDSPAHEIDTEGGKTVKEIPSGFCILSLASENECLTTLQLAFFGMEPAERLGMITELIQGVRNISHTMRTSGATFQPLIVCQKPVRQLLIVYQPGEEGELEESRTERILEEPIKVVRTPPDSEPPSPASRLASAIEAVEARYLSDPGLKAYLRNQRWVWLTDVEVDKLDLNIGDDRMPVHQLAFLLMYRKRVEEGFVTISETPESFTMYREVEIRKRKAIRAEADPQQLEQEPNTICAVQFVLMKDDKNMNVITELWVEPIVDGPAGSEVAISDTLGNMPVAALFKEHYDKLADTMLEEDHDLFNKLFTFDKIHALGRAGGGSPENDNKPVGRSKRFASARGFTAVTTKFALGYVLEDAEFATMAYHFPAVCEGECEELPKGALSPAISGVLASPANGAMSPSPTPGPFTSSSDMIADIMSLRGDRSGTPSSNNLLEITTPANLSRAPSHAGLLRARGGDLSLTVNIPSRKPEVQESTAVPNPGYWLSLEAVFLATTRRSRINLALCRYLERMIGLIADGEILLGDGQVGTTSTSGGVEHSKDLLERVKETIEKISDDSKENFPDILLRPITDSKCFVKIRDPHSFVLVFLPHYPLEPWSKNKRQGSGVLKMLNTEVNMEGQESEATEDETSPQYLALTVVECVRAGLPSSGIPITDDPPFQPVAPKKGGLQDYRIRTWTPSTQDKALVDGCVLAEGSTRGFYCSSSRNSSHESSIADASASETGNDTLSEYAQQFLSQLNNAFASAFTKSVYAALLQGYDVETKDLQRAVVACVETSIDIDITGYLNVRILSERRRLSSIDNSDNRGGTGKEEGSEKDVQELFREVLAEYFSPVPSSTVTQGNVYFYRPLVKSVSQPEAPPSRSNTGSTLNLFATSTSAPPHQPVPVSSQSFGPATGRRRLTPEQSSSTMPLGPLQFNTLFKNLECAETPLFIRTECSFRKRTVSDAEHSQIPVTDLPGSYRLGNENSMTTETTEVLDFTPEDIGTSVSPIESGDGTRAVLHLVCLTIPQSLRVDSPIKSGGLRQGSDQDSILLSPSRESGTGSDIHEALGSHAALNEQSPPSLTTDKEVVLQETARKIEALLEDEIMHALLEFHPVQASTVRLIEGILRKRHGINAAVEDEGSSPVFAATESGPSLALNFPLVFISPTVGVHMFQDELEQKNLGVGGMQRLGDLFCVVDELFVDSHEAERNELSLEDEDRAASNVHGLGISLDGLKSESSKPLDKVDKEGTMSPVREDDRTLKGQGSSKRRKFWLIVTVAGQSAQVHFFSKRVTGYDRLAIVRTVRQGVTDCCERVNRLYLLKRLSETHTASKYLIAPTNQEDESAPGQLRIRPRDDDDLSSSPSPPEHGPGNRFPVGRFACPLVFRHSFPLHWRLRPHQALSSIVVALEAFGIVNRKNMLVFAAKGSVFYMKMSVEELDLEKERDQKSEAAPLSASLSEGLGTTVRPGLSDSPKGQNSPLMRRSTISSLAPPSVVSGAPSTGTSRSPDWALVLEVFGVDRPGPQITNEFVNMVEVKINALTQHVLGTFLARNVTLKLTRADLDFILPAGRGCGPIRREWFKLPTLVRSPYVFLLLLRQNLLSWLHVLGGADVVSSLRKHYGATFGWADRAVDNPQGKRTYEVQLSDFSFLYNCIPTRNPTATEATVGQGIASICLALLDHEGRVMVEAPGVGAEGGVEGTVTTGELLEHVEWMPAHHSGQEDATEWKGYKLIADIWCQGSINLDGLAGRLDTAVRNTLMDYMVEATVGRLNAGAKDSPLQSAPELYVDTVQSPTGSLVSPFSATDSESQLKNDQCEEKTPEADTVPVDDFSEFYGTLCQVLQRAADAGTPTVQHLTSPVNLPSWIIEEFAAEVNDLLTGNGAMLTPVMLRRVLKSTIEGQNEFEVHRPTKRTYGATFDNDGVEGKDLYVAIVGLKDLHARYGPWRPRFPSVVDRKQSFDSDSSGPYSSSTAAMMTFGTVNPSVSTGVNAARGPQEDSASESATTVSFPPHHRRPSRGFQAATLATSSGPKSPMDEVVLFSGNLHPAVLELGSRSSFLVLSMENEQLGVFTYNWNRAYCDLVFSQILRILSWNNLRIQFLEKEFASLQQLGTTRQLNFRVPKQRSDPEQPVPASYGGDSVAMAMATHFAQRTVTTPGTPMVEKGTSGAVVTTTDAGIRVGYGMDVDTLQKHAVEFLDWFVRHIRMNRRDGGLSAGHLTPSVPSVFTGQGEGDRPDSAGGKGTTGPVFISASDMAEILRSVRLLHFVKYPLLFTEIRDQLLGQSLNLPSSGIPGSLDTPVGKELSSATAPTPLLSNASQATSSGWINSNSVDDETTMRWYRELIDTYLRDYVAYLRHLGLDTVTSGTGGTLFAASSSVTPKFWISNRLCVDADVTYLVRWFSTGVLIAQVGVDGIFGCVNLYTLSYSEGIGGHVDAAVEAREKDQKDASDDFMSACANLKALVHVNSYSYDFHLRYFQNILERRVRQPTPVDLLLVMKAFMLFNPRKANFACSRIHHGSCAIDDGQVSSSLFQYILKNPLRYGFFPIVYQGQPIACSLTSTTPDFSRPGSGTFDDAVEGPETVYTIVVYSTVEDSATDTATLREEQRVHQRKGSAGASSTSAKLNLRYFLLVVNMKNVFPHRDLDNSRSSVMGTAMMFDPLHEYLAGGYYLKDIVRHAERKVERLVEQALRYYGRDNLWRQLLKAQDPVSLAAANPESPDSAPIDDGMCEWTKLFLEKIAPNSRSLLDIDPDLADLFNSQAVPWLRLLDYLKSYYSYTARDLVDDSATGRRHLVLFNPHNGDYLLHFVLSPVRSDVSPVSPTSEADVTSRHVGALNLLPLAAPIPLSLAGGSVVGTDEPQTPLSGSSTEASMGANMSEALNRNPLDSRDMVCEVSAVSREGVADEVEYQHINDVVNTISFWLWSEVTCFMR
ncbi:uncharacterized protein SPPG_08234 [Spizellomyces punctatus DAOM BR117]|uniref:Uncharacterized protein n=1 Tax=Spizellomyces punctatus (strain DAOM BR117) TaxID=645134 RepID=A0A0L0H5Y5_SPIPD|nr:uncharacterized protein SPPG_08234 [Spizellomyces punctatus DAOM BR117]KNC96331.1 hypothetical protein SPPG_08234 [Spizellomyces punctatus DAOM BR117]|eukprot:XP_016604371.1 hypothetical protein SPPG_08234 [Spizellomyces punctatus DAOM BR117]